MWLRAPVIALLMPPRTPLVAGGVRTGLRGRTSGLGRRYLARHGSDRTRGRRGAPFDGRARHSPAADAVARALLGFANSAFGFGTSVGGVFLIGSMACLGVATLQNGGLPRWTGYAALAAAALALIAYLQVIVPALGPIFGIPGWLLHIAWVIGVAVALVRGRTMSTSHRFGYAPAGVTTP